MNETFTIAAEGVQQVLGSYQAVTVALALNAVGFVLKRTPLDNRWIPAVLLLLGTAAYAAWMGWTVEHVIVGIVVGASPVGFHQVATQTFTSTKPDETKP